MIIEGGDCHEVRGGDIRKMIGDTMARSAPNVYPERHGDLGDKVEEGRQGRHPRSGDTRSREAAT